MSLFKRIKKNIPWEWKYYVKRFIGSLSFDQNQFERTKQILLRETSSNGIREPNKKNHNKKLRIIYSIHQFFPTYYTGTEKYLLNLSKMMQKFGHEVHIITYQPHFEKNMTKVGNLYVKKYLYDGLNITAIHIKGDQALVAFDLSNKDIFSYFSDFFIKHQPDIFHIAHPMKMMSAFDAAKKLNIKTVMTLTDYWAMCPKGILLRNSHTPCMGPAEGINCKKYCYQNLRIDLLKKRVDRGREIFKKIDSLISPTKFVPDLFKINDFDTSKTHMIRHGFNFANSHKKTIDKSSNTDFCFAFLGSLIPHKGSHLLIQAFKALRLKNFKLKIYGDINADTEYFLYLKRLQNNDKRIIFEGKYSTSDLAKIHKNLDVVVLPSMWYENYPLVGVEALAHGVPIIVPDLTGARELVEKEKNGYIFEFGNARSLSEKMKQAYDNKLKENSSIFYNHSVEEEASLTEQLYIDLIN